MARQCPRNYEKAIVSFFLSSCLFWTLKLTLGRREWLLEVPLGLHRTPFAPCPSDGLLWKRPPWWLQLGKGSQELKGDPKYDRNVNLHSTAAVQSQLALNELQWRLKNMYHILSEKDMEEIQHAKANDSMPHSSQILSELPLFLPVLALQCQSVTNSPRSAENYCRNRRGDLISSGSYINYINSLTGQLLILFPGIIICIQLNLHKTTIVCFYLVPTFKVHKSF